VTGKRRTKGSDFGCRRTALEAKTGPRRSGRRARFLTGLLLVLLVGCASASSGEETEQSAAAGQARQQPAAAATQKPKQPGDPAKFAMIIAGVGGEEAYTRKFTALATKLYETLTTELAFDAKNTLLFTEDVAGDPENAVPVPEAGSTKRSTAEEVRKGFATLKSSSQPGNLILIVLIGHGSFDNQLAKFNLIGPDLSAKDYNELLASLAGRRIVFVNSASSSGEFVKPLSGDNRIIITATRSGNEQNATVFGEHFVAALSGGAGDSDKNQKVSVLEAFNYATKVTADWYKQNNRLATEHALIDDNGDGAGHETETAGDGALAKLIYLDSKSMVEAAGDAELTRLLGEKQKLEESIEKLKTNKDKMKPDEYDAELERLLVELARVNQAIKGRQKQ
jgi:hypothetical protein